MALWTKEILDLTSTNEDVESLKFLLSECGFGEGLSKTNVYDQSTKDAVLSFQAAEGLTKTGIADNETFNRLIAQADKT